MNNRNLFIFIFLFIAFGLYGIFFAQKIQINEGKGWDGWMYVKYAQEWPDAVVEKQLPPFFLKKTFLPALVHYVCIPQAMFQETTVRKLPVSTIIFYYDLLNWLWLGLSLVLLWKSFTRLFPEIIKEESVWICTWMVMNVFITKMIFYYPALLDTFAMMLGALLLYAQVTSNRYWILIAMSVGYFTHPLLFIAGALLYVWPERVEIKTTLNKNIVRVLLGISSIIFSYWLCDAYVQQPDWLRPVDQKLLYISVIAALVYLMYVLYASELLSNGLNYVYALRWKNVLPVTVLYVALTLLMEWRRHRVSDWNILDFLRQTGYDAIQDPFIFIVAHVVYYGPAILILYLYAGQWKIWLKQQAGGLQLLIWFMLLMLVNSESRQLTIFWPFILLLIIPVISEWKMNYVRYVTLFILIIWSRIWLDMHSDTMQDTDYYHFPAQYYFMHQGPWMSVENYYWQAAVVLGMMGLVVTYKVKRSTFNV